MAINDDLAYEMNESGERIVVKSMESVSHVYLRFTNRTSRPVEVSWRDFNGRRRLYTCMEPGITYDINTFLTHPWEFTDKTTKENYMINNKPIFRAPAYLANAMCRTNWNVTVGMRSLRHAAMLCIALIVQDVDKVLELELPFTLEDELVNLMTNLRMPINTE